MRFARPSSRRPLPLLARRAAGQRDAVGERELVESGGQARRGVRGAIETPNPDLEAPADRNGDNVYELTDAASDGSLSDTQALSVTVTDVTEQPPVITSNGGGATAALSVPRTRGLGGRTNQRLVTGSDARRET